MMGGWMGGLRSLGMSFLLACVAYLAAWSVGLAADPPPAKDAKKAIPKAAPPPSLAKPKLGTDEQRAIAERIANGHAYDKHVAPGKEFRDVKDRNQFVELIVRVMVKPTHSRKLAEGREAFFDAPSGTLVIVDPRTRDRGTCFRPNAGKKYFDNLR